MTNIIPIAVATVCTLFDSHRSSFISHLLIRTVIRRYSINNEVNVDFYGVKDCCRKYNKLTTSYLPSFYIETGDQTLAILHKVVHVFLLMDILIPNLSRRCI